MKIAIQLYNFRDELKNDFKGTLRKIAGLGADGVEFAGDYGGIPPIELADFLRELNLKCAGTMFKADALLNPEDIAYEYAEALHTPAVTISAFIDFASGYGKLRKTCMEIGRIAEQHGTVFSYHNHWLEFTMVDGIPAMERILENTSPENVFLEPDICWLTRAEVDPSEYLRKYARRIRQVHIKDIRVVDNPETTCELGRGVVDLKSAYEAALTTSCKWLIYEQDYSETPFDSASVSIEYLKKILKKTRMGVFKKQTGHV